MYVHTQAQAAGRVQERDALLPAVATLLRATPAEYQALRAGFDMCDNPLAWVSSLGSSVRLS